MLESSDADLVRRAQGGDVNAIGELYDRYHERIFRYVWSRVRDRHLAEDLTGEVFTRMVVHLPNYRLMGMPFQAWLSRMAHNLMVDHYRQEKAGPSLPLYRAESVSHGEHNPASVVEQVIAVEQVQEALDTLDEAQREVVVLRFLVGLPLLEVAQILNKTVAAVKSLQHRGLMALRTALEQV